jgi:peptide deformylase
VQEVTEFDDDLKRTLKEMFLVMYASKGVGLAAPQVCVSLALELLVYAALSY